PTRATVTCGGPRPLVHSLSSHGFRGRPIMTPPAGATVEPKAAPRHAPAQEVESITIRFAGDSGDGMQLAGTQFTNTSALIGNDIATFPDFPAEIRAPV